jgi:outer membrane protein
MNSLVKFICAGTVACGLFLSTTLAESPWSINVRATYLETIDESDAFSALGIKFPANAVVIQDKWIPEIDIDYAFSETLSAELVLTIPQKHSVDLKGAGRLGSFKHLPPTFLLQWRPQISDKFQPYIGAGANLTIIWDDNISVGGVDLSLENYSLGFAAQAGCEYEIADGWHLNVDIKKVGISTDVRVANGPILTEARLNPWLYSLGVRYEF